MPLLYRQDGPDALSRRALDDMVLFYHRPSGQTHMVISPVPEIMALLDDGAALTATQVHAALAGEYDLGDPDAALAAIAAHLDELVTLGLVRSA